MDKTSPIPWEYIPDDDNDNELDNTAGSIVCDTYYLARVWADGPNPEADGRLMALAPELLAFAREVARYLRSGHAISPTAERHMKQAEALIARSGTGTT